VITLGNGSDEVKLGIGNVQPANNAHSANGVAVSNSVTLGNGTHDMAWLNFSGNGNQDSVSVVGNSTGNDTVAIGNGTADSVMIQNTCNDSVRTGNGSGTVLVTSTKKTIQLGSNGWTQI
jgi:hypothetical protein